MSDLSVLRFRIFGSQTCKDCIKLKKAMELYSIDFEFIDTDDPKNDQLCDTHSVLDLPHIQAYRVSNGEVVLQKHGYVSPLTFLRDLSARLEEINFPRDLNLKGVRPSDPLGIKPTKKTEGGCNGCKNESQNHRAE